MIRIGIDPGISGALAALDENFNAVGWILMPSMRLDKASRVNAAGVAYWLNYWEATQCHVFLEKVGAMPGQGTASMFSFGHSAGVVEGVVAGLFFPITMVTPQTWKKRAGVAGKDKDAARARAIQLWPHIPELHKKGDGQALADALLIARFSTQEGE